MHKKYDEWHGRLQHAQALDDKLWVLTGCRYGFMEGCTHEDCFPELDDLVELFNDTDWEGPLEEWPVIPS